MCSEIASLYLAHGVDLGGIPLGLVPEVDLIASVGNARDSKRDLSL